MEVSLAGRTAVITGGSKGIGLAIATRFAASGADVAIIARGRGALDEAVKTIGAGAKGRSPPLQGDVGVAADIKRAYDEAMTAFGKIDIIVNNAGTSRTGAFEKHHRRDLARRLRPEAVRRHPADAAGMAADEGAALGPGHQHAQYRRQGAARRVAPRPRSRAPPGWR